jgi:arginyl-tRNA synthetase
MLSLAAMLADIRGDLLEFGVVFDRWYSERVSADERRDRPRARALAVARPVVQKRGRTVVSRD